MSCDSERTLEVCQTAAERQDYEFILLDDFAIPWRRGIQYDAADAIRPRARGSLEFVSSGGVSGTVEPAWPEVVGGTVDDGTITWTAQAVTFASLSRRIDTVTWSPPTGIDAENQSEVDAPAMQATRIWIKGGTLGEQYTIPALVVDSIGGKHECRLVVNIH